MHRLLQSQLIKFFGSLEAVPPHLEGLLKAISESYQQADTELARRIIVEDALRSSEERSRLLIETSPLPVIIYDELNNVDYVNHTFEELFGWKEDEIIGQQLDFIPEERVEIDREKIRISIENQEQAQFETQRYTKDGNLIDVELHAAAVTDSENQYISTIIVLNDITEEKKAAEALSSQNTLLKTINQVAKEATFSMEIGPLLTQIVSVAGEAINATSAYIFDWDEENKNTKVLAEYYGQDANDLERISDLGHEYVLTDEVMGLDYQWLRQRKEFNIVFANADNISEVAKEKMLIFGGKTRLELPLISRSGTPFGLLEVWDSREFRQFNQEEIDTLKAITSFTATALENAKLYQTLQNNEERLRKIFINTNDVILIMDSKSGEIFDANPKASQLLGYTQEALTKLSISDIHPGQTEKFMRFAKTVLQQGEGFSDEFTCTTRENATIPIEISASIIDINNRPFILSVIRDISEQKEYKLVLEEQQAFLRQVVDTNPSLVFAKDREGRYTLVNQAMAKALNAPVEEIIGQKDSDFTENINTLAKFAQQDSVVFDTGEEILIAGEFTTARDGTRRWRETIKRPLYDKHGKIANVLGVVNDITAHKETEEILKQRNRVLEILNQLSRDVSVTRSLGEILANSAKAIADTIGVTSVYISDWTPETGMATVLAEYISDEAALYESDPSVGEQYNLPESFEDTYNWLQDPEKPLITHIDDPDLSPQEKAYKEVNNLKTSLCLAIMHESQPIGYIELYESRQKHIFTQTELDFLQTITYQISTAINNARLFETLQDSQQRFSTIIDSMPFGVTIIDKNTSIITANNAALAMMGYDRVEDIQGHICHDTMCPAAKGQCPILDLDQDVDRAERVLITKDGITIPILKSVIPIIYDGKEVLLESFIDISRQKKLEEERQVIFQRRGTIVQSANQIAREIVKAQNLGELYQNAVNELHSRLNFYHTQILQYNPASDALVMVAGSGNIGAEMLERDYFVPINTGLIGKAASKLSSILISDTSEDPNWTPNLYLPDTRSEIAVPIAMGDNILGVLDIHSSEPGSFDTDIQLVLEVLAGQIAVAIESLRLRSEMEERLRELTTLQKLTTTEGWQSFDLSLTNKTYTYDLADLETIETDMDQIQEQIKQRPDSESILLPMEVRGEKVGTLGIQEDHDRPLTEEEKALLRAITEEVAEALERARLFEASQRSAAELTVLNEMGNAFTESLNIQSIIENIFIYSAQLVEVHEFFVALYDEASGFISFPLVIHHGERITKEHPDWQHWETRPLQEGGLTGHVIRKRQSVLIENNAEEVLTDLNIPFHSHGGLTQSLMGVPMAIGDRVMGIITVQSDRVDGLYTQHHLDLLNAVASQAAIAIDNARLFLQEQARAEQERLVRTITDKVRRGADAKQIMRITLEELSNVLNADESVLRLGTKDQLLGNVIPNKNGGSNDQP